MSAFMSNFEIFMNYVLQSLSSIYSWFIGTIIGQIFIFVVIISIFIYIIYKLVGLGG